MADKERNVIIANNIKSLLKERRITQKALAMAIGISPSTLSDYMNLRSNPSHGVIQKIADYFEVNKSDIDTTFKENTSKIEQIYTLLTPERKDRVLDFAEFQLKEQTKEYEVYTLAAHSDDPDKEVTQEDLDNINSVLDELDRKFDKK
ncbi:helix-turn-helix domain-containing protein [Enterococcus xiangfangensis]|uniref:helix-turn-helix domain-containing protein n=1 Tax=Enterococcus xiangfangensis TaxID=1296537 RepID=UPI003D17F798|nr:XRE family transcriptional regulator [Enterococcus asini]